MRKFSKAAAALAVTGLATFGTLAATGGVASAATNQMVTGCNLGSGLLNVGVTPTCTAPDSTVQSPSSITIAANPSFFSILGNNVLTSLLGNLLGEKVTYTLNCSVNGTSVVKNGSFQATNGHETQTIDLQAAVGSPQPNSCTVKNLKASSLLSLSSTLLDTLKKLGLGDFTFGVTATANNAVPGAIMMQSPLGQTGLHASSCVDDAGNGNLGSAVQVYQCNSDLAQQWVQTADGQLVRNGDCLTQAGTKVTLDKCTGSTDQKWTVNGVSGQFNTIINAASSQCLTAPSLKNFSELTVANCTSAANQLWTGPAAPAMVKS